MKLNKLASAISRGKWLIEPRTAMVERQRAVKFLAGDISGAIADMEEPELDMPFAIKPGAGYWDADDEQADIFASAESGAVAIIPICGTIMKYDYCGSPGTDTLSSWLQSAIASPQIDAVVLLINSGGGSVEGTGEFADLIAELSAQKPILALSDGMIASAAYWIGCSANELWVTHKTVEIGSIGVAVTFYDDSKYMEEHGLADIYINADTSPDKNMDYFNAIKGDFTGIRSSILNPTDDIFMSSVKGRRDGKLKLSDVKIGETVYQEPLTGKVYLAEAAIENGLIDSIGNMEAVIARALELASNKDNNISKNSNLMATKAEDKKEQKKLSTWDKLINAIMGIKAEEEAATVADEDEEAKKADDDEEMAAAEPAPAADTDPDDDDDDDADPDKDDDSDEDEVEVNGKTFNMKKPDEAKAAVQEILAQVTEAKKATDATIADLQSQIAAKDAQIAKTTTEVKKEIKSSFVPKSSSRSANMKVEENQVQLPQSLMPKEGSIAAAAAADAVARKKAADRKK